ncbi:MAG: glycerate kinase, partial [Firmicutes bacterium]|nr:glycerate kinase [Bacillota bacterium]
MNFLFASDSFKGSLSSAKTAELLERAAKEVFPDCSCSSVPMADGGEGTAEAVIQAAGGKWVPVTVRGPLGEPVEAGYGLLPGGSAIIEMASASGLVLVDPSLRDPRNTSTFGTGELIAAALKAGCKDVTIAIGGSATNDGGMGCASALGVRFYDANGTLLTGRGDDLARVANIDVSGLLGEAKEARFTVMSDVDNPLLGPDGATFTFGPQKGAVPQIRDELEAGMENYAAVLKRDLGADTDFPGAGAAGGLGAALKIFLNADMRSGAEAVLDLAGFDALLEQADLVVTGEGRIDWQSSHGKVVSAVAKR